MASAKMLDEAQDKKKERNALMTAITNNQYCTDKMKQEILYRKTFENIRDTIFPEELLYPMVVDEDVDIAYVAREQLKKVHGKTVDEDGNIHDKDGNIVFYNKKTEGDAVPRKDRKKKSSMGIEDRIVASIVTGEIALRITKDFC
jgi:hypothetical protein